MFYFTPGNFQLQPGKKRLPDPNLLCQITGDDRSAHNHTEDDKKWRKIFFRRSHERL
jgi:hypothetical protein